MSDKRFAKDFDPSTRVVENWKYMNALEEIQRLKSTMVREAAELAVILHHEDITQSLDHHLYKIIQRIKKVALPPKDTGA